MKRGILDPADHYFRRVFTDAVRAVAAAGLVPDLMGARPDVPFLCHFRRAVHLSDREPPIEISTYLSVHRAQVLAVFRTLSYLDGVSFARRATAAMLITPARIDSTTGTFSPAGNTGGLTMIRPDSCHLG